jgi:hypothetical protein
MNFWVRSERKSSLSSSLRVRSLSEALKRYRNKMPVNKVKEQFELKERVRSQIQLLREAKRRSNLAALSTS